MLTIREMEAIIDDLEYLDHYYSIEGCAGDIDDKELEYQAIQRLIKENMVDSDCKYIDSNWLTAYLKIRLQEEVRIIRDNCSACQHERSGCQTHG